MAGEGRRLRWAPESRQPEPMFSGVRPGWQRRLRAATRSSIRQCQGKAAKRRRTAVSHRSGRAAIAPGFPRPGPLSGGVQQSPRIKARRIGIEWNVRQRLALRCSCCSLATSCIAFDPRFHFFRCAFFKRFNRILGRTGKFPRSVAFQELRVASARQHLQASALRCSGNSMAGSISFTLASFVSKGYACTPIDMFRRR